MKTAKDLQVGFPALSRAGEVGAYATQKGFSYAVCDAEKQDALLPSAGTMWIAPRSRN